MYSVQVATPAGSAAVGDDSLRMHAVEVDVVRSSMVCAARLARLQRPRRGKSCERPCGSAGAEAAAAPASPAAETPRRRAVSVPPRRATRRAVTADRRVRRPSSPCRLCLLPLSLGVCVSASFSLLRRVVRRGELELEHPCHRADPATAERSRTRASMTRVDVRALIPIPPRDPTGRRRAETATSIPVSRHAVILLFCSDWNVRYQARVAHIVRSPHAPSPRTAQAAPGGEPSERASRVSCARVQRRRRRERDRARAPTRWALLVIALAARLGVVVWAHGGSPPSRTGTTTTCSRAGSRAGTGYTWLWPDGAVTYVAHYPVGYPAILAAAYALFGARARSP